MSGYPRKVLISPGFGAGFAGAEAANSKALAEDPGLIEMVEKDEHKTKPSAFHACVCAIAGDNLYMGGTDDLVVVTVNGPYCIAEYDGAEYIQERDEGDWW